MRYKESMKFIKLILLPITIPFALVLTALSLLGVQKAKDLLFYYAEDDEAK